MAESATQLADVNQVVMDKEGKYLTFALGSEEYGLEILTVREIIGYMDITSVPQTPDYVKGVINLRGAIVPIVDLRQRFQMEPLEYGPTTVVVVLRVKGAERERVMGIVVDAVSDVYNIPEDDFRPAPKNGNPVVLDSIRSLATVQEKMVILLDIDHLLNSGELAAVDGIGR